MSRMKHIWRHWFTPHDETPPYMGADLAKAKLFLTKSSNIMAEQNSIAPKIINANLDVIEQEVLTKLPSEIYNLSKAASDAIGETAKVMFDGEEPNGPQVEKIWRQYANLHLVEYAVLKGKEGAEKINSEILRNLALLLLIPAQGSLKDLTDENPDDAQQLKDQWVGFLKEGENLNGLLKYTLRPALLLVPVITEQMADFIVNLAEGAIQKELEKI